MSTGRSQRDQPLWVVALLAKDLSATEFRVWMLLYRYQGGNGSAWPSQETIAEDLGLTPEGVRKIVLRLQRKGWLKVVRPTHTTHGKGLEYQVVAPEVTPTAVGVIHPNGCLGDEESRPNGEAEVAPTAVPPYKRIHSGSKSYTVKEALTYDFGSHRFVGIADDRKHQWSQAYPDIDVGAEILKAGTWCRDNPQKARAKRDWPRFLGNWLARAQRDAESRASSVQQHEDPTEAELDAILAKMGVCV